MASKAKPSKILVPLDGSAASLRAAKYAVKLARMLDADMVCIHVVPYPPLLKGLNPALIGLYFNRAENQARKWLAKVEELALQEKVGIKREITIDSHSVPESIIGYAESKKVNLIVMGTRGRGVTKRLLLGSVAAAVTAHAKCAVLLVP